MAENEWNRIYSFNDLINRSGNPQSINHRHPQCTDDEYRWMWNTVLGVTVEVPIGTSPIAVEVGSLWGGGTAFIATSAATRGWKTLCFDAWGKYEILNGNPRQVNAEDMQLASLDTWLKNMSNCGLSKLVVPILQDSMVSTHAVLSGYKRVAFGFVDCQHYDPWVTSDLTAIKDALLPGGVMASHESDDPNWQEVKVALDALDKTLDDRWERIINKPHNIRAWRLRRDCECK